MGATLPEALRHDVEALWEYHDMHHEDPAGRTSSPP